MGGKSSGSKGSRRERQLVTALHEYGFAATKIPASGSATERNLPDVLAGKAHYIEGGSGVLATLSHCYAIELKSSSGKPIYIDGQEIYDVGAFSVTFGAHPLIGVRFDEKPGDPSYGEDWPGFYFVRPPDAHMTSGGNYRVKKETAIREGIPLPELRSIDPIEIPEFEDED